MQSTKENRVKQLIRPLKTNMPAKWFICHVPRLGVGQAILFIAVILQVLSTASAQSQGAIEKVWVEYGVKVNGETGIRIHTKFSVKNALNTQCVIQANVQRADGHTFLSSRNTYATKDGKAVLISKPFTPPFDPADYPDTRLFFPYWALNLEAENPNKMKLTVTLLSQGKEFARATIDFGVALGKGR
ncbi:MAG: hypothetical protein ABJB40_02890 [Acidobacteriota bacterium]